MCPQPRASPHAPPLYDPDLYKQMVRREPDGWARYLTFSCVGQRPLFHRAAVRDLFVLRLIDAAERMKLLGGVVMPKHVHLLVVPEGGAVLATLRRRKPLAARDAFAFWERESPEALRRLTRPDGSRRFRERGGGHDRLIGSHREVEIKRRYTDANPVRRGMVDRAQDRAWSSARSAGWNTSPVR